MQIDDNCKKLRCQDTYGIFSGVRDKKVISGVITCNSWKCPACRPKKLKKLRARIFHGAINNDVVSKYGLKFCTLTFGGKEKREEYFLKSYVSRPSGKIIRVYDLARMYDDMIFAFNKLNIALQKKYGKYHYLRIYEPHKDGVPHFHILFVGNSVIPKGFRSSVEKLWRFKYGFGFIRVNSGKDKKHNGKFSSQNHAINYMLKYMTKDLKTAGKYKRIFSASKYALEKTFKMEWDNMQIFVGRVTDKGQVIEERLPDDNCGYINFDLGDGGLISVPYQDAAELIQARHIKQLLIKRECD